MTDQMHETGQILDTATDLAAELRTTAARLALLDEVVDTDAPREVLYAIAKTVGALRHPVGALCRRAAEATHRDPQAVAELAACDAALAEAAAKVRFASDCF